MDQRTLLSTIAALAVVECEALLWRPRVVSMEAAEDGAQPEARERSFDTDGGELELELLEKLWVFEEEELLGDNSLLR
eukprot:CAMPEP_0204833420 /NCGR_PEP_ID=MMETSP1346-20131115/16778_1 /ASSEMBLY_ACC=CAM_ASM_000771 /TAXON_ID=215587 /ORGANISM="Aplanochytrium stocchinoi, Strain GSBS06" /LENGTH=77 /DNA_ID=CAMNT_0051965947 /DNA_START=371 /DNA_END=604 /DNA_ORIENTATION=-